MRLVVAVDGSPASDEALDHALDLAAATGGSLTVVHAVDPAVYETPGTDPGGGPDERADRFVVESESEAEARGERLLDEAVATAADRGVTVHAELLHGDPREVIPDLAADEGYDGIVVGHRGLPERQERVLGSTAKAFVERAPVPVTVVRAA